MGIMCIKHILEAKLKYLCTIGQGTDSFSSESSQDSLRAQCLSAATLACRAPTQTQHFERVN